jgi:hypothetical protein
MMNEAALVSFARSCLAPVLGEQPAGRFFLAGGAFKSLLHGLPPRDLDLWPATEADRERLGAQLVSRGAKVHRENPPYQTSYILAGQRVELAHDSSAGDLQVQLGRFDLGLSAIGVEHLEGTWRGAIHPLALDSIRRREVLLLTPLVNWKYALATLERMRRYATELGYHVPASEEEAIWDVFDEQSREEQRAMVARYLRVSLGGDQVLHEAQRRTGRQ